MSSGWHSLPTAFMKYRSHGIRPRKGRMTSRIRFRNLVNVAYPYTDTYKTLLPWRRIRYRSKWHLRRCAMDSTRNRCSHQAFAIAPTGARPMRFRPMGYFRQVGLGVIGKAMGPFIKTRTIIASLLADPRGIVPVGKAVRNVRLT